MVSPRSAAPFPKRREWPDRAPAPSARFRPRGAADARSRKRSDRPSRCARMAPCTASWSPGCTRSNHSEGAPPAAFVRPAPAKIQTARGDRWPGPSPRSVARALPGERVPIAHRVALLHHRRVSHHRGLSDREAARGPLAHPRLAGARRRSHSSCVVSPLPGPDGARCAPGPIGGRRPGTPAWRAPVRRLRLRDPEQPLGRGVPGSHLPIGIAEQCREGSLLEQSRDRARPGRDSRRRSASGRRLSRSEISASARWREARSPSARRYSFSILRKSLRRGGEASPS